jgi:hypothetical protein
MTDNDTTEAEADAPTADTGGAVEILRLMPPTAWEGMLVLGKIATDPKAFRRMLRALHDSLAAETEAQKKTRDERAPHSRSTKRRKLPSSSSRKRLPPAPGQWCDRVSKPWRPARSWSAVPPEEPSLGRPRGNTATLTMMVGPRRRARACRGLSPRRAPFGTMIWGSRTLHTQR